WLTIDPATGELSGTALTAGAHTVTVRVAEPTHPWNQAEQTMTLYVRTVIQTEGFETCPAGWTFGLEWECGAPTSGPNAARTGSNVIGTTLAGNYATSVAWGT